MHKILVTGGTGFIGRRVVNLLIESGHKVRVLTKSRDSRECMNVTYVNGDICNHNDVKRALRGCDGVIHLAGVVDFRDYEEGLLDESRAVNVLGTRILVNEAKAAKVERFVYVSSAITLGWLKYFQHSINERSICTRHAMSRYSETKNEAEIEVLNSGLENISIVWPTTATLAPFMTCLYRPVQLYAPGGTNIIDVDDVARGIVAAYRYGGPRDGYLLSGYNVTYDQIYRMICKHVEKPIVLIKIDPILKPLVKWVARKAGDKLITPAVVEAAFGWKWYDNGWTREALGWEPELTLEQTIKLGVLRHANEQR